MSEQADTTSTTSPAPAAVPAIAASAGAGTSSALGSPSSSSVTEESRAGARGSQDCESLLKRDGANGLAAVIASGRVRPGDVLLFARPGLIQAGIAFAQRRALADLTASRFQGAGVANPLNERGLAAPAPRRKPLFSKAEITEASRWTHAAQLYDRFRIAEQTSPRAQFLPVDKLEKGLVVLVRRPWNLMGIDLKRINDAWLQVVASKADYPERELVYYWFRWASKLTFRRHFAKVFRDGKHNVCSGTVVQCMKAADYFKGEQAEAWYPARMAIDGPFMTVGTIEV